MPVIPRADVVGSLLRPQYLLDARHAFREGRLSRDRLRQAEDRGVLEAIELQESAGIQAITDGEYRRASWIITSEMGAETATMSGFSLVETQPGWLGLWRNPDGTAVRGVISLTGEKVRRVVVTGPVEIRRDVAADEFAFLKQHCRAAMPKYTFPAPSWHRIDWDPEFSAPAYASADDLVLHMRDLTRRVVERLVALGCGYIQLDAPNYAQWHTDPDVRTAFEREGYDMDRDLAFDAEVDNSVFDGIDGVIRAMHICRGNAPGGRYFSRYGYEPIAAALFPKLTNVDTLLLEYDTARAGGFGPLRQVLPGKTVVLGLVSTKTGVLEDADRVEERVREAAQYIPLDRLALSPQCGFASGSTATTTSHEEQAAKLRLVGEAARRIWG